MAISRTNKEKKIKEIKEKIESAKVAIVADYKGLSVEEITALRRELQKQGADCTVVKNTLAKIAIKDTEFEKLDELCKGTTALVLGFEDQVAPAKVLTKFIKDSKKAEIKGGVLDNAVLSAKEVGELAKVPSKEELYAKILGSVSAPARGMVFALNGIAQGLVRAMEEVRKQKEAAN